MTSSDGQTAAKGSVWGAALAMALICSAQFVLQLDFSIVNVALPTIQRELGMPAAQLQWIVTGYALTFGSLLLAGGRLADLLGRRRLLAAGLVLFAIASLACGLAQWSIMLIISRVIQGAAGAMVSPAALSLLTTTNPEGPARNRALAIWQATTAAGATTGIIAGAVLAGYVYFISLYLQRVQGFTPVDTGLALVPSTATVVLTSTLVTRRLLARFSIKQVLLGGLAAMGAGQLWFAQITAGASYPVAVLPGLMLTALGIGLALPTASIAITSGVQSRDQGLAGALFTTSQQTGAAVGLAVLATAAAVRTAHASGSLVAGYRLSFLIATGMSVLAAVLITVQLSSRASSRAEDVSPPRARVE